MIRTLSLLFYLLGPSRAQVLRNRDMERGRFRREIVSQTVVFETGICKVNLNAQRDFNAGCRAINDSFRKSVLSRV